MPANLPPQYFEAEKGYRLAKTPVEKVKALEAMLSLTPKHKGTERLRAELRAKTAKLTQESQKQRKGGKREHTYYIRREGAGQAVLIGLPNVGKSQILSSLTHASPEVAEYPFTTQNPSSGMMRFENIQIQLVDLPPIVDRSAQPWLSNVVKSADVLLLAVDLSHDSIAQVNALIGELERFGIKPVGEGRGEGEEIALKKALIVGNKSDLEEATENYHKLSTHYGEEFTIIPISAKAGAGLAELRGEIFKALDLIRVYTKAPGEAPDFATPFILRKGSAIEQLAAAIHNDFHAKLKYAQIWGSAKFDGQKVRRDYLLNDGDIVEFHI